MKTKTSKTRLPSKTILRGAAEPSLPRRDFLKVAGLGAALTALGKIAAAPAAAAPALPAKPRPFVSGRPDGRFVQTAGFLHQYLGHLRPRLEYTQNLTKEQFAAWQQRVREKLTELMAFPEVPVQPEPVRVWSQPRQGYALERWEAYPEPYSVVPFYLLVPDGVSARSPAPAVMCFPGSGHSKELLAGEPPLGRTEFPTDFKSLDNRMAYHYAQRGMIGVAFDCTATNEQESPLCSRVDLALQAAWMGRTYDTVTVFQKACVLRWLIRQPQVDASRIAVSGHSLGAKPADILGVLYPDVIRAVVHNDFVCNWRERSLALNLYGPSSYQVVPGFFQWFDYTDLQAALAPKPLLFTEGGRPKQYAKIRHAYQLHQANAALQQFHYEKYTETSSRQMDEVPMPTGLTMEEYFEYAYVQVEKHRFRPHHAVPWLAKVFNV